jgi:hypothetical protein
VSENESVWSVWFISIASDNAPLFFFERRRRRTSGRAPDADAAATAPRALKFEKRARRAHTFLSRPPYHTHPSCIPTPFTRHHLDQHTNSPFRHNLSFVPVSLSPSLLSPFPHPHTQQRERASMSTDDGGGPRKIGVLMVGAGEYTAGSVKKERERGDQSQRL